MSESATMQRVTTLEDRVLEKLDTLTDRVADVRVEVAGLRGDLGNVRALVDGMHHRAERIEEDITALRDRVVVLEAASTAPATAIARALPAPEACSTSRRVPSP